MTHARLIDTAAPSTPRGIVLVLHGGARAAPAHARQPTQLSVLRMVPVASRIARAAPGELAVLRLLNSTRGWDAHHTPVDDVRWALRAGRGRASVPTCRWASSVTRSAVAPPCSLPVSGRS